MIRKVNLILLFTTLLLLFSCESQDDKQTLQNQNKVTDSCGIMEKRAGQIDSVLMNLLEYNASLSESAQTVFLNLAYFCTGNKKSPEYLIKAVQLALQDKNYARARKALEFAENNFVKSEDYPMVLFMLGELYADPEQLNDTQKANEYFNKLEKEFPASTWAKMVPDARKWIGKSKSGIAK
jgi:TolA-binding protein